MNTTSLNALQESTLIAFNKVIKTLNKADTNDYDSHAVVERNALKADVRELHNNLAFLLGHIDPETGLSLWLKHPDKMIDSITWDED
jgi:hypothetical protein